MKLEDYHIRNIITKEPPVLDIVELEWTIAFS